MRTLGLTIAAGIVAAMTAAAGAADLPKLHVKAIGLNGNTVASERDEVPFWTKTVPEASGGKITADIVPVDRAGIKDFQMMRMSKLGVTDFGAGDISKMAGEDPVFEGCDLAGLTLTPEAARAACEAWKPTMARVMEQKFSTKLLAVGANPPQVFWCREPISGLADLKGKKVRVFNKTMNDFITAVGGTTVSMAFAEVVPALQRGVVDCAVTGSLSGNTAGWPEVSSHLYPLSLGWSVNYQAVGDESWNKFAPEVKAFFETQFDAFEDKMWATVAKATEEGESCNFDKEPCTLGKKVRMTRVPVSDEDQTLRAKLMQDVVLLNWGKRCGKACAEEWNATVGKVVDLQIPVDKI